MDEGRFNMQRVNFYQITLMYAVNITWMLDVWASQVALVVKNLPADAGDTRDMGSIPGLGRSPEVRYSNPLQLSCLGNFMDRGA